MKVDHAVNPVMPSVQKLVKHVKYLQHLLKVIFSSCWASFDCLTRKQAWMEKTCDRTRLRRHVMLRWLNNFCL